MDGERIVAFGPQAAAWARRLPATVSALVAEDEHWEPAFDAAVQRRRAGEAFLAVPLLVDRRARFAFAHAAQLLAETSDANVQLAKLDRLTQLSAEPQARLWTAPRPLRDFLATADGIAVRSLADYRRLGAALGTPVSRLCAVALPDPAVPADVPPGAHDATVVWGPEHTAVELALVAFTLAMRGGAVVVVCRSGTIGGLPVEFVGLDQAATALSRAARVVDVTLEDPGAAIALARLGRPLLVHSGSGAAERLEGVLSYDAWDHRSLYAALDASQSAAAPAARAYASAETMRGGRSLVAGERARRWAERRPHGPVVILSDDSSVVPDGTEEAIEGGGSIAPMLADLRVAHVERNGHAAWASGETYDLRRDAFDALGAQCGPAQPLPLQTGVARNEGVAILGFASRAHRIAVRSWLEAERLTIALGRRLQQIEVIPRADPLVPAASLGLERDDAIVVWAPHTPEPALLVILQGLAQTHRPVIVVGAPQVAGTNAKFLPLEDAAGALSRALVVVDATVEDPGSAIALGALGLRLAVASTTGADEYLDSVNVYDPWSHISVLAAVTRAIGLMPAVARRSVAAHELAERLEYYAGGAVEWGPLVSVLMMTRDRRVLLERALTSLANQWYRNFEVVLVRNGGVRLDDFPARFPFVRLIDREENLGVVPAGNLALDNARGKYVTYLADDDAYLPDHLARAVAGLERTGDCVAHAGMIAVHLAADGAGGYDEVGYGIECLQSVDLATLLAANYIGTTSMMISTERLPVDGRMHDSFGPLADYELVLRMATQVDLHFLDMPTVEQSYRQDVSQYGAQQSARTPEHLRALFAAYPYADHPWTQRMRRAFEGHFDQHVAQGGATPPWFPPPAITIAPRPFVHAATQQAAPPPQLPVVPHDVVVIRLANGSAATRNAAWRASEAPYVVFTDAELAPFALDALRDALTGDVQGAAARVCTNDRRIAEAGLAVENGRFVGFLSGAPADHPVALRPRDLDFLSPHCFALRRSLLERLGGFDERYAGPFGVLDLCVRARLQGARLQYRPDAVAIASATSGFAEREEAQLFAKSWERVFTPPLQAERLVGPA